MNGDWSELALVALGGGLVAGVLVKLMDIAYQVLSKRKERERQAKSFVAQDLDPLMKAVDEVVGKLRSLAERDSSRTEASGECLFSLVGINETGGYP